MTVNTYKEIFHYMMFPVCAVLRGTGEIVYKNLVCDEHFPKLTNKKGSVHSFIISQKFNGSGAVKLIGSDAYHTAVALNDGEYSVFLFFKRFQYDDGIVYAAQVFQQFGPFLTDFLAALRESAFLRIAGSIAPGIQAELYKNITEQVIDDEMIDIQKPANFCLTMSKTFEKLNSAVSKSGYTINARMEEDFPQYLRVNQSIHDVIFILGRLIFLQAKLSKTKNIDVTLTTEVARAQHVFHITTQTNLSEIFDNPEENLEWILKFIPECKMEISLLQKIGFLTKENFTVHIDRFGYVTLLYGVSYTSPETFYVCSNTVPDICLLYFINDVVDGILEDITNNGASC